MLENSYPIRTDLALESQERLQEDQADMRGIRVLEERRENGVIVSTVMIETENASVAMGRDRKSTRLNSSHNRESRMPSSA